MKRYACVLLIISLVLGSLFAGGAKEQAKAGFNETGYPIVDKPVTLKVFGVKGPLHRKPFNELPVVMKTEKITNVKIDWIEVPLAGVNEKKNLMLASGDLPDMFATNLPDFDIVTYGAAKVFVPLQDLIEKYAPNYKKLMAQKSDIKKFTRAPDGNTYTFARLNEGSWMRQLSIHGIYKPWMDKLGKAMPKTTDEFYDLMVAFKQLDLGGQVKPTPIAWAIGDPNAIARCQPWFVYYAFGLPTLDAGPLMPAIAHLFVEDGKVKFGPVEERFKQATQFLNKLYKAGLLEREGFTLTENQIRAKVQAQPPSYGVISFWNLNDEFPPTDQRNKDYVPLSFFSAPGVSKPAVYRQPYAGWNRGHFAITKANKYPEVSVRWADYMYDPYNSMEWIEGMIGSRLVKDANGVVTMKDPPAGMTTQEYRYAETQPDVGLAATMEMYRTTFPAPLYELKGKTIDQFYAPSWAKDFWSNPLMSVDDSKQLNAIDPDLRSYFTKMQVKWITEGGIEAEWNDYLAQMEKLGVKKMLQIRQAAYERQQK